MSKRTAGEGTRLTLDLWHPNYWAIGSASEYDGGTLAHTICDIPAADVERSNGLFTAYDESLDEVETLLDAIANSKLADEVLELQERFDFRGKHVMPGPVAREFFLEHDPSDMMCLELFKQGFVHSALTRVENDRRRWEIWFVGAREEIQPCIEAVMNETGAEIRAASISASEGAEPGRSRRFDTLTRNQREVFELAREEGYCRWSREVSTRELAAEMDISKTTPFEHLHKTESKLLDPQ